MQEAWTIKQKFLFISGSFAIAVSIFLGFKYVFPLISPFVIAYIIALAIEKPVNKLSKLFRGKNILLQQLLLFFWLLLYLWH